MPGFTESAITLNFPDDNYFRLRDCPGYRQLSGHHFKEVDACWHHLETNTFWLKELKDYTNATEPLKMGDRAVDIAKKCADSLAMFLCVKHNYPFSQQMTPVFNSLTDAGTILKVLVIVKMQTAQQGNVQVLNDLFKHRFRPHAELFGIASFTVIEHSRAVKSQHITLVQ